MRFTACLLSTIVLTSPAFSQYDRSAQALARAQSLLRQVSAPQQELEVANARMYA